MLIRKCLMKIEVVNFISGLLNNINNIITRKIAVNQKRIEVKGTFKYHRTVF